MDRPRCSAYLGMSLDGFIARPDGSVDWLMAFPAPMDTFEAFYATVDTVLIGRATYDLVLTFQGPFYEGKRVAVLTHRPPAPRHGETFVAGAPADVLAGLAASGSRSVYVDGGAVVSQFLAAGLLDALTVTIVPIVLGEGRRLFQGTLPERRLAVDSSRAWDSGLVQIAYRVA